MAKVKDFAWDEDLIITNGDILVRESDVQHIQDLIESSMGSFKEYPSVGVGLRQYQNGRDLGGLQSEIIRTLSNDGYEDILAQQLPDGQYLVNGVRNND